MFKASKNIIILLKNMKTHWYLGRYLSCLKSANQPKNTEDKALEYLKSWLETVDLQAGRGAVCLSFDTRAFCWKWWRLKCDWGWDFVQSRSREENLYCPPTSHLVSGIGETNEKHQLVAQQMQLLCAVSSFGCHAQLITRSPPYFFIT